MDVLIAPVGEQDPFSSKNGQPGSVLAIATRVRPTVVYLLPTRKPVGSADEGSETYEHAVATQADLERLLPGVLVEIYPLSTAKPNLLDPVLVALEPLARRLQEECAAWNAGGYGPVTIHVNVGSGTPAIKQAMTLLVSSGLLTGADGRALVYVVDNPERTPAGADRVHQVDLSYLEELRLTPAIEQRLDARDWSGARGGLERLGEIVADARRADVAQTAARLLAVYECADRLEYDRARTDLAVLSRRKATARVIEHQPDLAHLLDDLRGIAEKLATHDRCAIAYDLLSAARHRWYRGDHAEALARTWYLLAAVLQERLAVAHGIDVSVGPILNHAQRGTVGEILNTQRDGRIAADQSCWALWCAGTALGDGALLSVEARRVPVEQADALNDEARRQYRLGGRMQATLDRAFHHALRKNSTARPIATWGDVRLYLNVVRNLSVVAHGEYGVPAAAAEGALLLLAEVLRAFSPPCAAITDDARLEHFRRWLRQGLQRDAPPATPEQ